MAETQKNTGEYIEIKGARVNNLKNISLKIPRNQLIVITGVSGSGKSSLAFDTLYAEGQRRYVESLSAYARQFLGRMNKPECDYIKGLPPAIAIEQKVNSRNPRSTVGTSTEIYEYLRLLFARVGRTFSPVSGEEVRRHSVDDVVQKVYSFSPGTKYCILAPLRIGEGRTLRKQLEMELQQGFVRIFFRGEFVRIEDALNNISDNEGTFSEEIFIVIDRLSIDESTENLSRLADSVETALYEGDGACRIMLVPSHISYDFSTRFEADGIRFEEPDANLFSFNSPMGACPECEGFGNIMGIDERLVVPNTSLSVYDGCVQCWQGEKVKVWKEEFCHLAAHDNFPIFKPYYELAQAEKDMLWHGLPCETHLGMRERTCIDSFFKMLSENQYKIQYRVMLSRFRGKTTCPVCRGTRLKKEAGYVKINGRSIQELVELPIRVLYQWFDELRLPPHEALIAKRLLTEITNRLQFLMDVGLEYLTLNRMSNSLSGGESQRINLTTSLGSPLVGSLYILDEPSIGLHSRDTARLIGVLRELQKAGNTVIVVEHDEEIMRAADYLIDIGPDAGYRGGEVVFAGRLENVGQLCTDHPLSHTLSYLSGNENIPTPFLRRPWNMFMEIKGARMNNLRGVNVRFALNVMNVVVGVSGSGKSSLVKGILYPLMKRKLDEVADIPGDYMAFEGDWQHIKHVEMVDQNPIGKSTRSNPATYMKAYDLIRQLFADQPLAKQMGFTPQYFSFNTDGGRCEECKGAGKIIVEMQFMADLELECESCHGQRFKHDVLDVKFQGMSINDVLNMTVAESLDFFTRHRQKNIADRLRPLYDVGLGYIKLGQSSSTLSGGENQRVKLAYFLGLEKQQPTLFIFDEPTTGLHFQDIHRLLKAFDALLLKGHTIVIVEHNVDVIKCADHVIELGPGGGEKGGNLICMGTPEDLLKCPESLMGKFLQEKLV